MRLKEAFAAAAGQLNGLMAQSKSHHNPEKNVNPVMPALLRRVAADPCSDGGSRTISTPAMVPAAM